MQQYISNLLGMIHGLGFLTRPFEYTYKGTFRWGKKVGFGVLTLSQKKEKYEGKFENDLFEGEGKYFYQNGDIYSGNFKAGQRHGLGSTNFTSLKELHEGQYQRDEITGPGIYKYANGNIYTGDFLNGLRHGHGKMQSPSGDSCEGTFSNGTLHGELICKYYYFGMHWSTYKEIYQNGNRLSYSKLQF